MEEIIISDWDQYGSYMIFATMVNETEKWVMIKLEGPDMIVTAKPDGMKEFCKLLRKKKILFKKK